ncbi:hypothetical protein V7128_01795 [Neobacillus vireti]
MDLSLIHSDGVKRRNDYKYTCSIQVAAGLTFPYTLHYILLQRTIQPHRLTLHDVISNIKIKYKERIKVSKIIGSIPYEDFKHKDRIMEKLKKELKKFTVKYKFEDNFIIYEYSEISNSL